MSGSWQVCPLRNSPGSAASERWEASAGLGALGGGGGVGGGGNNQGFGGSVTGFGGGQFGNLGMQGNFNRYQGPVARNHPGAQMGDEDDHRLTYEQWEERRKERTESKNKDADEAKQVG